jgi:FKBP-type peptidyl-prolyl cis-trans isomerase FkpA
MKRIFMLATLVALTVGLATACNNEKKAAEAEKPRVATLTIAEGEAMDSLSYTIGASMGLAVNFTLTEEVIDAAAAKQGIIDFYKSGDVESEAFKSANERYAQFQNERLMPYMFTKYQNSMNPTEEPMELPALYDDEYTKQEISTIVGNQMGAGLIDVDGLKFNWAMKGFDDGLVVESEDMIDEQLALTQEQMQEQMMQFQMKMQDKARQEYEKTLKSNKAASEKWLAGIAKKKGVKKTESGILYRIDRKGTGEFATLDSDVVLVNYEGKTRDGKIFDSSYERGEPISFPLNRVIKGWTEGMKLVAEGGQITLWIPAELAYGERGAGQDIGPNEALQFKVELLEVNPEE